MESAYSCPLHYWDLSAAIALAIQWDLHSFVFDVTGNAGITIVLYKTKGVRIGGQLGRRCLGTLCVVVLRAPTNRRFPLTQLQTARVRSYQCQQRNSEL